MVSNPLRKRGKPIGFTFLKRKTDSDLSFNPYIIKTRKRLAEFLTNIK